MSIAGILDIARGALLAQQRGIDVTSHNVANAATPGYSRQRIPFEAAVPLTTPTGTIGRGVVAGTTQRVRDQFLDENYRAQSSILGGFTRSQQSLAAVESMFNELGDQGIAGGIAKLLGTFGDLANLPTSAPAKVAVQAAASDLVQRFHTVARGLGDAASNAFDRMQSVASQVTDLGQQIQQLNQQIQSAPGGKAPDLEDQRDKAIDQLSTLVGVRTVNYGDGTVGVMAGQVLLADATAAQGVVVRSVPGGGYALGLANMVGTFDPGGGEAKSLATFTQTTLPGVQAQVDQLASALVGAVNALHLTGNTGATGSPPNQTNVPFFAAAGVTAASIDVAPQILQSAQNIATGTSGAPGDSGLALQLAQLRTTQLPSLGGQTMNDYFNSMVTGVGIQSQNAINSADAQKTLVAQAEAQRQSVSGVNTDEELINLIQYQNAYSAAAKIVTTADQMLQTLLAMKS